MAQKKSFRNNPAMQFISTAEETQEEKQQEAPQIRQQAGGYTPPEGFRLVPELKTARMQLLLKESTKAGIRQIAEEEGRSMNDLVSDLLDQYVAFKAKEKAEK